MAESHIDGVATVAEVVVELRQLRRRGLLQSTTLQLPALTRIALARGYADLQTRSDAAIERIVREAIDVMGPGEAGQALATLFGVRPGLLGRRPSDLRREAAEVFGLVSVESFRKRQEPQLIDRLAQELLAPVQPRITAQAAGRRARSVTARVPGTAEAARPADPAQDLAELENDPPCESVPPEVRRYGPYEIPTARGAVAQVVIDLGPVEQLRDVDLLVSSENTYLLPDRPFRNSLSGSLRAAAAIRADDGSILDDVVARELSEWMAKNARPGGSVELGVVAVTSAGALSRWGVRALLHAAVVRPRTDRAGYEVESAGVARAVARCFDLARIIRQENEAQPVSAISLPLFGTGEGGLDIETAASWLWTAVHRELLFDSSWRVHLTTWNVPETRALLSRVAAMVRPR